MKKLNQQVGKAIKSLRLQKGLTQEEFAEASGIHEKHVGIIETGKQGITLEYLCKVAKGLDIPVTELVKIIFLLETSEENKDKDWLLENISALLQKHSVDNLKSLHHLLLQIPSTQDERQPKTESKKEKKVRR